MADFEARARTHGDGEAAVDEASPAGAGVVAGAAEAAWSPSEPAKLPAQGPLPGLFTSAGGGDDQHLAPPAPSGDANAIPYYLRKDSPPTMLDIDQRLTAFEKSAEAVPERDGVQISPSREIVAGRGDPAAPAPTGRMMAGVDQYATETEALAKSWQHLDPTKTADTLRRDMNGVLAREDVPKLNHNLDGPPDGATASFASENWAERINSKPFHSAHDVEQLGASVFHEGRHAEQHFNASRLDDNYDANEALSMNPGAAGKAHRLEASGTDPMSSDERASARRISDDLVGNEDQHLAIEHRASNLNAESSGIEEMIKETDPDTAALMQGRLDDDQWKVEAATDDYARLPTEQDAFAAERVLTEKIKTKR